MTQFHNCTHLFIIWDAAVYRFRIPRCSMVVACINKVLVQRCTHFWSQVTANFLFSLKKCLFFLLFVYFGILQQMCKKICHDLRINDSFFSFTSQVCRLFTSTVTEPLQLTSIHFIYILTFMRTLLNSILLDMDYWLCKIIATITL